MVKTFKNSTAERVPSECSQLRYTSDILEYLFKSTAERVQLGPIYLRYISLVSQSFLLPCWSCRGWLWIDSWILFWSLTWISEKKVKVKGNAKIGCNSNCYYYFNRPFFLFSPIHCDVLGHKLKESWSDLSLLSASDILRYIFCPAECIRTVPQWVPFWGPRSPWGPFWGFGSPLGPLFMFWVRFSLF